MLSVTFAEAVQAMSARPAGSTSSGQEPLTPFPKPSIDTRAFEPGQAYFAIKGERLDGHAFIRDAVNQGARVVVVDDSARTSDLPSGPSYYRVEDTTRALQELAALVRTKWGKPLIAVTGSMGKTTTRHFTSGLLSGRYFVHQTTGNLNNHIGLPLTLLQLEAHHDISVVELGMNHPGEIRRLSEICRPDSAVITNVAPVHTEFFNAIEEIADAKAEILDHLNPDGMFFFNADDPLVSLMPQRTRCAAISFGFSPKAEYRVTGFQFNRLDSMELSLLAGNQTIHSTVPFCGKHLLANLVAAAAVALEHGVSSEAVRVGMSQLSPLKMRGDAISISGITILDDSYNSNPNAVMSVLETVTLLNGYSRKIIVLGDMFELGDQASFFHEKIGEVAAKALPDQLITVGSNSRRTHEAAIRAGHPEQHAAHFGDTAEAASFLADFVRSGDLVFVKGSRGMKMDSIITTLRENRH